MEKTVLKVHYSPRKDCFVAIPRQLDAKLLNVSNETMQCTVLKVQTETEDKTVFLGVGRDRASEPNTLEINGLYATKLGIKHGDQVIVNCVTGCLCDQVFVEPLSVNDWEILELHANFVEGNLLNQVRVVWEGQILPIWVSGNICIFVDIGKLKPACEFAVLQTNTEVIVAPKDRRDARKTDLGQGKSPSKSHPVAPGGKQNIKKADDTLSRMTQTDQTTSGVKSDQKVSSDGRVAMEGGADSTRGIMSMFRNLWAVPGPAAPNIPKVEVKEEVVEDRSCQPDMLDFEFEMLLRVQPFLRVKHRSKAKSKGDKEKMCDKVSDSCGGDFSQADASSCEDSLQWQDVSPNVRGNPLDPEQSKNESRIRSLEYEQPMSVFVDLHTVQKWWTPGKVIPRHFLAKIIKVLSPDEKEEHRKYNLGKTKSQQRGGPELRDEMCGFVRVVVTDSPEKQGYGSCLDHVTVPDHLRQLYSFEATGRVIIEALKTEPKDITKLTLYPVSKVSSFYTKEMIKIAFMTWLRQTTSYSCPMVLNNNTTVSFRLDSKFQVKYLVSLASEETTPCQCYILIYPHVVDKLDILVMCGSVAFEAQDLMLPTRGLRDIDPEVPKSVISLGGVDQLLKSATIFLDTLLAVKPLARELFSDQPGVQSGCLLICGPKGAGKSLFCSEICERFSKPPHLAYVNVVKCMTLRGKRPDTIQKILSQALCEAEWRQPSLVVLDDLDHVCSQPSGPETMIGTEALYYMYIAEVIKALLQEHVEKRSRVAVIATVRSMSSIHQSLIMSRGIHYFQEVIEIKPPNQVQRHDILVNLIKSHPVISPETTDQLDFITISGRTEGFIARDLSKVVDRAFHASLSQNPHSSKKECTLEMDDFEASLEDFTPSALHHVSLQVAGNLGWEDVGGLKNIKGILEETFLLPAKYPKLFSQCPLRLRSGILLYGPPGTGKTLLAGVVSKECGLNFISIKGPELLSKYIGASEQAVRDTFTRAQSAKPCILFFDEFESIAPRRGHDSTGVTDRVVNQLLTQLDGVEALEGVYVLAASSRPDLIDPALLRPGRLDKSVLCPMPNENERLEILEALTRKMILADDVDLAAVAKVCEHFTGADFKGLLYSAQLEAIHGQFDSKILEKSSVLAKRVEPQVQKVIEKPRDRITYMPSLEEGVVELAPDLENRLEEQIANLLEPFQEPTTSARHRKKKLSRTLSASRAITVTQDHLMKVALELQPSVSATERWRFEKIYESFVSSRGGIFGSQAPPGGQRATLS
ncbi:peroxisomal ATPase PEX1-like [Lineus longissimus]|uniref:peroxisomal ATPase PEX1-like n=1 Tax=Lineus longissimus TaxID=88925 RepID=UPI002B4F2CE6